jgi:hypothetical protein
MIKKKNGNQKNEDQNWIKKLNEIKYWGPKLKKATRKGWEIAINK